MDNPFCDLPYWYLACLSAGLPGEGIDLSRGRWEWAYASDSVDYLTCNACHSVRHCKCGGG